MAYGKHLVFDRWNSGSFVAHWFLTPHRRRFDPPDPRGRGDRVLVSVLHRPPSHLAA